MNEAYGVALGKYNKALKQRNDLIKNEDLHPDDLFSWDVMCAHYGTEVLHRRVENLEKINGKFTAVYREIAKNEDKCALRYIGELLSEDEYLQQLQKNFRRDLVLGHSTFGPHRDDYEFVFNGTKADGSASRGEIRSMVWSLKSREAQILENELGKKPVVLLDDIFSELDEMRQKHLIDNFKDYQMIITSTAVPGEMLANKEL